MESSEKDPASGPGPSSSDCLVRSWAARACCHGSGSCCHAAAPSRRACTAPLAPSACWPHAQPVPDISHSSGSSCSQCSTASVTVESGTAYVHSIPQRPKSLAHGVDAMSGPSWAGAAAFWAPCTGPQHAAPAPCLGELDAHSAQLQVLHRRLVTLPRPSSWMACPEQRPVL